METKRGAHFWLRVVKTAKGIPDEHIDIHGLAPQMYLSKHYQLKGMEVEIWGIEDPDRPRHNLIIKSGLNPSGTLKEYFCTNPELARILVKSQPGTDVQFDPQEIVDSGLLSSEEMAKLGHPATHKVDVKPIESKPVFAPLPSFATMDSSEVLGWLGGHDIAVPPKVAKDRTALIDEAEKEAKKLRKEGKL